MFETLLARYPIELFPPERASLYHLIDSYTAQLSLEIVRETGVAQRLDRPRRLAEVFDELGIAPAARSLLARAVQVVQHYRPVPGAAAWTAEAPIVLDAAAPLFDAHELRARGLALDPRMAPAFEIVDKVREQAVAFASCTTDGVTIRSNVHVDFFLACPIGLECSQFGGLVIRAILEADPRDAWDILELGGGTMSGALSTLDALTDAGLGRAVRRYQFTEINPFFVLKAAATLPRRYPKIGEFHCSALDFNQPLAMPDTSVDLAFGVNCLQCAADLPATMSEIFRVLRPGGWLVIPQYTRGANEHPLPLVDLVCEPLASYWDVHLCPELRPIHGMPTFEIWQKSLARLGYVEIRALPDAAVGLATFDPKYYVGTIIARKPAK